MLEWETFWASSLRLPVISLRAMASSEVIRPAVVGENGARKVGEAARDVKPQPLTGSG
jgi:hypothetical protein